MLVFLGAIGCSSPESGPFTPPANSSKLLTGDSTRSWKLARRFNNRTRMNMNHCFLSFRQVLNANKTFTHQMDEGRDCGASMTGDWKVIKDKKGNFYLKLMSDQIPEQLHIEDDFKLFKIINLSEDLLTLQYSHKQFSDKTTKITDFYVPEGASIEGRDFHW